MIPYRKWCIGFLIIVVTTIFACAGAERYEYRSNRDEATGSGIFSGDDGYFEIYKKEKTD